MGELSVVSGVNRAPTYQATHRAQISVKENTWIGFEVTVLSVPSVLKNNLETNYSQQLLCVTFR